MSKISNNKSTQRAQIFVKAAHYPDIAWINDLESQHGDPDHPKNLIKYSLYHCRRVLKILRKSTHNLLSNGRISDWTISMVIQFAIKFNHVHFTTLDPSIEFHHNPLITF